MQSEQVRESLPSKTERAVELATEKGASNWLTVIPIKEMNFNLNKREFRDAIKLRYDWEIADLLAMCTCGDLFTVDHAMVCRHGGLIIQRHNEIRDLEAEMLRTVCTDVEIEPVLQGITGEELNRRANKATRCSRSRVLGQTAICFFRCSGVPSKRRFVSRTVSETDIPTT